MLYSILYENGGRDMINPKLHYLGMILLFIGIIIVSGGVYMGAGTRFHSTLEEQGPTIMIGLVPLIVGGIMWLYFDE